MARFGHRPKRISRRAEREKFEHFVMPAAMMCFPAGIAIVVVAAAMHLVFGSFGIELVALGAAVLAIPGVLHAYRFFRGHFSRQLRKP